VGAGAVLPGGLEQAGELVTVEARALRLRGDAGSSNVGRGGARDDSLALGVAVEAGERTEPAAHGRGGQSSLTQVGDVGVQVAPADGQQVQPVGPAPVVEVREVPGVRLPRSVGVAQEEAGGEELQGLPRRSGDHCFRFRPDRGGWLWDQGHGRNNISGITLLLN
jgi:hypothetical protein